ncbi:hypothetical protein Cgig2_015398 [Carnegiea gigantea]|uniref:Uncharacterized protein n=1 Tax=Carnegiea gigantea TaxID=171969 RepID=A0A9Q1JTI6_9CARY|nr:hypothetical protein Cgig2_015398 [Carnegiea gigantea]
MTIALKPHNVRKYEFHEQNGHTTAKCKIKQDRETEIKIRRWPLSKASGSSSSLPSSPPPSRGAVLPGLSGSDSIAQACSAQRERKLGQNPNAPAEEARPLKSEIAMNKQMLCHDESVCSTHPKGRNARAPLGSAFLPPQPHKTSFPGVAPFSFQRSKNGNLASGPGPVLCFDELVLIEHTSMLLCKDPKEDRELPVEYPLAISFGTVFSQAVCFVWANFHSEHQSHEK